MPFKTTTRTSSVVTARTTGRTPAPVAAAIEPGSMKLPKRFPTVDAWSFSRYKDYVQCPLKFACKHLMKWKEPGNAAMDRGTAIHKLAEDFTQGKITKLPKELSNFKEEFNRLAKKYKQKPGTVSVEGEWAFNRSWEPVPWFGGVQVYARIKLDVFEFVAENVGEITDHKTGQHRAEQEDEYVEQLQLYALASFRKFPTLVAARPRILYLDHGKTYPADAIGEQTEPLEYFKKKDEKNLVKLWDKKVLPMFTDTRFAPTANSKCHWCHYRKANGGPCKY
jgi:PD-(D/E)XK nuclease superfamily